jgi:hypothetical protein
VRAVFLFAAATFALLDCAWAQSSAITPVLHTTSGSELCTDLDARIYREFNTLRKVKLATAYFVNPDLVEKADVLQTYQLATLVEDNAHKISLWNGFSSGQLRLLVKAPTVQGEFLPIAKADLRQIAECGYSSSGSTAQGLKGLAAIDFSSEAAFTTSLGKLPPADMANLKVVASKQVNLGSPSTGSLVSWDPIDKLVLMAPSDLKVK